MGAMALNSGRGMDAMMSVTAVVSLDKAGRIVIPKGVRDSTDLEPGTKFLLVEAADGRLWLQRLDARELAKRIHRELSGVNLAPLIRRVEAEANALAKRLYPAAARR